MLGIDAVVANAKSPALVMPVIQTGLYSAASRRPTTAAFTPRKAACASGNCHRRSQNGSAPATSRNEDRRLPQGIKLHPPSIRLRSHYRAEIGREGKQRTRHGWQSSRMRRVCNLYSMTKNQAVIIAIARALRDITGNLPILPGIFPDYMAPVVRNAADGPNMRAGRTRANCTRRVILLIRNPIMILSR
jgi:hypothetical protein